MHTHTTRSKGRENCTQRLVDNIIYNMYYMLQSSVIVKYYIEVVLACSGKIRV